MYACKADVDNAEHFLFSYCRFNTNRAKFKVLIMSKLKLWPPPMHLVVTTYIIGSELKNFVDSTDTFKLLKRPEN